MCVHVGGGGGGRGFCDMSVSLICSCVFYQCIKYVQPILRNSLKCAIRHFFLKASRGAANGNNDRNYCMQLVFFLGKHTGRPRVNKNKMTGNW